MVTAENITCRKCKVVGIQNFKRGPVYVAGGDALDVISCLLCSDWYSSRPLVEKMERPVDKQPGSAQHNFHAYPACAAPGCSSHLRPARAEAGETLCSRCKTIAERESFQAHLPAFMRNSMPKVSIGGVAIPVITGVEIVLTKAVRHPHWTPCAKEGCTRRIRPDRVAAGATLCKNHAAQRISTRSPHWTPCLTAGCPRQLRPSSVAAGHTLCGHCRYHAARNEARTQPQEVNHVEPTVIPVSVVPAAAATEKRIPEAGAVTGERRNDQPGIAALSQILANLLLRVPVETIATWTPDEEQEVLQWAATMDAIKDRRDIRIVPAMPEVLCPIYDASQERKSA